MREMVKGGVLILLLLGFISLGYVVEAQEVQQRDMEKYWNERWKSPLPPEAKTKYKLAYTFEYANRTYQESPHGKTAALGKEGVPTCTDCHGMTDWMYFLPQSDPNSPINPKNRPDICAREDCHGVKLANAGKGSMHGSDIYSIGPTSVNGLINFLYKILISTMIGFFVVFEILDFTRKHGKGRKKGV